MRRTAKAVREAEAVAKREGLLAACILARRVQLDPASLRKSYGVPEDRVRQIIARNGGSIG